MIAALEMYQNSLHVYNIKQFKALQQYKSHAKTICNLDLPT